jgi:hypothetical protein
MIPRSIDAGGCLRLLAPALVLALTFIAAGCQKVPLLAPSGSTIILTAANNVASGNGTVEIVAQVLEPAGTPPHPGTHVTFTTTIGVIEPSEQVTDINGRARVLFKASGTNGTATITASSGGATTGTNGAIRIAVGTAAVGRVIVNATPATIPSGGTSTITASVIDVNGTPLTSTAVSFATDAGALGSSLITTNADGVAATTLTTSQTATVTASVGATAPPASGGGNNGGGNNGGGTTTPTGQTSGTARVTVVPNTTVVINPPDTAPSAGVPARFTFVVTVPEGGNPVRDLRVSWGDGSGTTSLGAVSGTQSASHVYDDPGSYTITATLVDVSGISQSVSTSVTVIPIPRPTIIVTPTPRTQTVGGTIDFEIRITTAQGIGIQNTTINFGDGQTQSLGGATDAVVPHQYSTTGQKLVTVTVTDTANQTTQGTTTVSITP